jgi:8-oxo-dGTP diphosphatase
VGCIIRDSEGKIYVHHNALKNEFFFPGGKVDTGETVEQASVRELQEELELTVEVSDVKKLSSMKVIHG